MRKVPDWLLERLALGELDAHTADDVRRRLLAEGRSPDDVLARLAESNRQLLAAHPPAAMAATLAARAKETKPTTSRGGGHPRRRAFIWGTPLALGAMAAAVLFLVRPKHDQVDGRAGARDEYIGIKGAAPSLAPRLYVYRHGTDGDERLPDGAPATPGDLVQVAYRAGSGGYGVLLSIDGARRVTLHWPDRAEGSAPRLRTDAEVRLPSAYELDDAPAFERFFLIRSPQPFAIAPVMEAARALANDRSPRRDALPLPAGFEQTSLVLDKRNGAAPGPAKESR